MPRRQLLSRAEADLVFEVPHSERELVRHYTLTPEDLAFVRKHRGASNRLGVALQLSYLRYPGTLMPTMATIPLALREFVAEQLDLSAEDAAGYGHREMTRLNHVAGLCREYNYRRLSVNDRVELHQRLVSVALRTTKGMAIALELVDAMRHQRIIVPLIDVVDRMGAMALTEAEIRTYDALLDGLDAEQLARLDQLLTLRDKRTWLTWLRQPPGQACPANFLRHLERLKHSRSFGLGVEHGRGIHQNHLRSLARLGAKTTPQNLQTFAERRRRASLVAVVLDTRTRLTDELLAMSDQILGSIFRKGGNKQKDQLVDSSKELHEKMRFLTQLGRSLLRARDQNENLATAIESVIPWERLEQMVGQAQGLIQITSSDSLPFVDAWYSTMRQYAPSLLRHFEFKGTAASEPLLEAIALLAQLNTERRRKVPLDAPTSFVRPQWARHVFVDGIVDRHFYEFAVLAELRNGLRAGDIWVRGSGRYRSFHDYLLTPDLFADWFSQNPNTLAVPREPGVYFQERSAELRRRYAAVNGLLKAGKLPEVTLGAKGLRVDRLVGVVPDSVDALTRLVYSRLPRIKITDLLVEVDSWTQFGKQFTHLRTAAPADDRLALFAAILGDATNLGPVKMAASTPGLSARRLCWTADWCIREDAYRKAMVSVVNFHHQHPFATHWGDGSTSSSDGQAFRAGSRGKKRAVLNAKYGRDPVVMFYTHVGPGVATV